MDYIRSGLYDDNGYGVAIRANAKDQYWMNFVLFEVISIEISPCKGKKSYGYLCHGFIKWDSCTQWYCNTKDGPMLHFDSADDFKKTMVRCIDLVYSTAEKLLGGLD